MLDQNLIGAAAVAAIAGFYGYKGHRATSKAAQESARETAAANVKVAELNAEVERLKLQIEQQRQVHDEAKGIWGDATAMREELRGELARERERSQKREMEMQARIETLEQRVDVLTGALAEKAAEADDLRRRLCAREKCAERLEVAA